MSSNPTDLPSWVQALWPIVVVMCLGVTQLYLNKRDNQDIKSDVKSVIALLGQQNTELELLKYRVSKLEEDVENMQ